MSDSMKALQVPAQCPVTIAETVCVQADITIMPDVVVGDIQSFCAGAAVIGACPGTLVENCTFSVSQNICVQIPLTFSALAVATPTGIVCGTPAVGACTA